MVYVYIHMYIYISYLLIVEVVGCMNCYEPTWEATMNQPMTGLVDSWVNTIVFQPFAEVGHPSGLWRLLKPCR